MPLLPLALRRIRSLNGLRLCRCGRLSGIRIQNSLGLHGSGDNSLSLCRLGSRSPRNALRLARHCACQRLLPRCHILALRRMRLRHSGCQTLPLRPCCSGRRATLAGLRLCRPCCTRCSARSRTPRTTSLLLCLGTCRSLLGILRTIYGRDLLLRRSGRGCLCSRSRLFR